MVRMDINASWGSRATSAVRAGEDLARCLSRLRDVHPVFGQWYKSWLAEPGPVTADDAVRFSELFAQGRNHDEDTGEVIEEFGYQMGMWNGQDPSAAVDVGVGAHVSRRIHNVFNIGVPGPGSAPEVEGLYEIETAQEILSVICEVWSPETMSWYDFDLTDAQVDHSDFKLPWVGWLTYFQGVEISDVGDLPGYAVKQFGDGVLIQATERFEDLDLDTVMTIRRSLDDRGMLISLR